MNGDEEAVLSAFRSAVKRGRDDLARENEKLRKEVEDWKHKCKLLQSRFKKMIKDEYGAGNEKENKSPSRVEKVTPFLNQPTERQAATRKRALEETGFAYQNVVRNKEERKRMPTHTCPRCEDFIKGATHLNQQQIDILRSSCRHRSYFPPPSTPEGFWDLSFADSVRRRTGEENGKRRILFSDEDEDEDDEDDLLRK